MFGANIMFFALTRFCTEFCWLICKAEDPSVPVSVKVIQRPDSSDKNMSKLSRKDQ